MKNPKYFDLLINKMGWGLLALGSGPLILISLLAKLGIWPDANPNPIGLGIMALFTFWPSVTCIVIGTVYWLWEKKYSKK